MGKIISHTKMATGMLTVAILISLRTVIELPSTLPRIMPPTMQSATHKLSYLSKNPMLSDSLLIFTFHITFNIHNHFFNFVSYSTINRKLLFFVLHIFCKSWRIIKANMNNLSAGEKGAIFMSIGTDCEDIIHSHFRQFISCIGLMRADINTCFLHHFNRIRI